MPLDDGVDEIVLRRETPEHRSVPDAGAPRDLVDARVRAVLGEDLGGRVEDPLEVPPSVGAELDHQAIAATGSVSMSCSMVATCRFRSSATKTIRLSSRTPRPRKNA